MTLQLLHNLCAILINVDMGVDAAELTALPIPHEKFEEAGQFVIFFPLCSPPGIMISIWMICSGEFVGDGKDGGVVVVIGGVGGRRGLLFLWAAGGLLVVRGEIEWFSIIEQSHPISKYFIPGGDVLWAEGHRGSGENSCGCGGEPPRRGEVIGGKEDIFFHVHLNAHFFFRFFFFGFVSLNWCFFFAVIFFSGMDHCSEVMSFCSSFLYI